MLCGRESIVAQRFPLLSCVSVSQSSGRQMDGAEVLRISFRRIAVAENAGTKLKPGHRPCPKAREDAAVPRKEGIIVVRCRSRAVGRWR